ncbi:MAG: BlaI/MecI/CopY family transcriptional regulator [Firmicutes bacterium]|nr:BlaI/MecI/CopY family transcriptional regulator [Bacillota bacterium]
MNLSDMEWKVMELLWEKGPVTGREAVECLEKAMGWSRSTTLTHLRRMEAKGAVCSQMDGGLKTFTALIPREEAALAETEDFLSRVYKGSLSMMVSAFTQKQSLSRAEIDQLYEILEKMEGGGKDD